MEKMSRNLRTLLMTDDPKGLESEHSVAQDQAAGRVEQTGSRTQNGAFTYDCTRSEDMLRRLAVLFRTYHGSGFGVAVSLQGDLSTLLHFTSLPI